jgi:tRNA-dihydrouridine synthase B
VTQQKADRNLTSLNTKGQLAFSYLVESARIATAVNPDLIDINYGCPVKAVACRGAGAALLQDIPKMVKMTEEIVKCTHLPVTVKTRLGWDDNTKNIVEVAERLQDIGIQALTVHGRTRVQMYKGSADWTLIAKIKENPRMHIPIFGNGDIDSPEKALEYKNRYGIDGIMVGRAAIGYPWIFNEIKHYLRYGTKLSSPDISERVRAVRKHLDFSIRWKGDRLGIFEMRKHYTNYFRNLPDFKQYRIRLVESDSYEEILEVLDLVTERYSSAALVA